VKVVMKLVSVLLVAVAAFLVYAVIHATASAGGARVGVCIAYIAGAFVFGFLALRVWRRSETSA